MKRTAYIIEGQSFTEPSTLPDGFTVKTVEVADPKDVTVYSTYGTAVRVHEWNSDSPKVSFMIGEAPVFDGFLLDVDSARQVRDCLNAILDEDQPSSSPSSLNGDSGLGEAQCYLAGNGFVYREVDGELRIFDTAKGEWSSNSMYVSLAGLRDDQSLVPVADPKATA